MGYRIEMKRILVPTDFSENAGQAFLHAAATARWTGAELIVLHVVEKFMDHSLVYSDMWPFQKPVRQYYEELEARIADRLQRDVRSTVGSDVTFRVVVSTGSPAPEIVLAAEREVVDLIVIATHGRGGIAQALLGSTTERVLRRAPCPVLVIRSGAPGFVQRTVDTE
jgi:nucleotide-binding universal stress UspA family protein